MEPTPVVDGKFIEIDYSSQKLISEMRYYVFGICIKLLPGFFFFFKVKQAN